MAKPVASGARAARKAELTRLNFPRLRTKRQAAARGACRSPIGSARGGNAIWRTAPSPRRRRVPRRRARAPPRLGRASRWTVPVSAHQSLRSRSLQLSPCRCRPKASAQSREEARMLPRFSVVSVGSSISVGDGRYDRGSGGVVYIARGEGIALQRDVRCKQRASGLALRNVLPGSGPPGDRVAARSYRAGAPGAGASPAGAAPSGCADRSTNVDWVLSNRSDPP
jgi:hypothetical protein